MRRKEGEPVLVGLTTVTAGQVFTVIFPAVHIRPNVQWGSHEGTHLLAALCALNAISKLLIKRFIIAIVMMFWQSNEMGRLHLRLLRVGLRVLGRPLLQGTRWSFSCRNLDLF